jgi:hypothetical protein
MTKLYVLIDEKLSFGQKLSQSGHAVAQFMIDHPGEWMNETITILDAPRFLIQESIELGASGFQDTYFKEPRSSAFLNLKPSFMKEIEKLNLSGLPCLATNTTD